MEVIVTILNIFLFLHFYSRENEFVYNLTNTKMAEYSSDSDSMEEIEDEPSASAIVSREVTQNSYF